MISANVSLVDFDSSLTGDAATGLPDVVGTGKHPDLIGSNFHVIPKDILIHKKGAYYKLSDIVNYKLYGDKMSDSAFRYLMATEDLSTIAGRLRYARTHEKKTQEEVAKAIGKDTTAYGHYERGRNEMMRETAILICKYLKINLEWLMTGEGLIRGESFELPPDILAKATKAYLEKPAKLKQALDLIADEDEK